MTYIELIKKLRELCCAHPLVSSVYFNRFSGSDDIAYPALIFINTGIGIDGGFITYQFTAMYVDQLMSDGSNAEDIQSVGVTVVNEINNRLYNDRVNSTANALNIQVFRDQFADKCAGVVATGFDIVASSDDCVCFDCECQ